MSNLRDPSKYCVYVSNFPFIDNDGYVALCCKNTNHKLPYHISEHKLSDIWNSSEIKEIRRQLAYGEEPKGCHKCFEPERQGVRSFRQKALGGLLKQKGKVAYEHDNIIALDMRLGNVCNLACTMCFAGNSNSIYNQLPKMADHWGWSEGHLKSELEKYHAKNYGWPADEKAWDNILPSITANLRRVYFAGGEPMYLPPFIDAASKIREKAPQANISINTNGTRLLRDKDLIKFKKVNPRLRVSIDGWGKSEEFTRQNTVWEEKLQVMDQYYKEFGIDAWDITCNVFTFRHLRSLVENLSNRYPDISIQIRPVVNRQELAIKSMPWHFRKDTFEWIEQYNTGDAWEKKMPGIDHLLTEANKPYESDLNNKKKMRHLVKYYENVGTVKLEEFDPELAEWLFGDDS